LVSQLMLSLSAAFQESAPDLYAQTAGEMLAAHLEGPERNDSDRCRQMWI
jgi:hypothetical protein